MRNKKEPNTTTEERTRRHELVKPRTKVMAFATLDLVLSGPYCAESDGFEYSNTIELPHRI